MQGICIIKYNFLTMFIIHKILISSKRCFKEIDLCQQVSFSRSIGNSQKGGNQASQKLGLECQNCEQFSYLYYQCRVMHKSVSLLNMKHVITGDTEIIHNSSFVFQEGGTDRHQILPLKTIPNLETFLVFLRLKYTGLQQRVISP